jgi:glycosyltransferase involved in cell wall biosynthesis
MISIVIPAYKSAHTITATLDSVRSQTFRDYEVLITDDGSSDGTLDRQYAREHPEMRISTASIPIPGWRRPAMTPWRARPGSTFLP